MKKKSAFKFVLKVTCKTIFKKFLCIECDKGGYGPACNETCGHCRDVHQCSNIDGTCLTGCSAGYRGYLCKTILFIYKYSLINSSLFLSYTDYLFRKIYEQLQCSVEVLIIPTARTRSFTWWESIENLISYYDAPPILEVFIYFKRCQENFSRHLFKTILVAPKIA